MVKTTRIEREYYILGGDGGMKKLLIEKGINISPEYLMVISPNSKLGKMIKKEIKRKLK